MGGGGILRCFYIGIETFEYLIGQTADIFGLFLLSASFNIEHIEGNNLREFIAGKGNLNEEDALKIGCKNSITTLIALLTGSADVDLTQLVLSEKRLIGSQTYTYLDYHIALSQNESNKLDMFEKLITDVFSPEDAMPVIDDLSKHKREDSIKNLIKF